MPYVDGFVCAVPRANRDAFIAHARQVADHFIGQYGALQAVDCWEDDVADGKVTDFRRAVQAKADEAIAFSWVEYPDRAARDRAMAAMASDPRMAELGRTLPFDGQRLIYGGFAPFVDARGDGPIGYVDGFVLPVTEANRPAYTKLADDAARIFVEYGAIRDVETWGDDVPHGQVTDFYRSVQATPDERVVFSWIGWPSRAHRDEAWAKVMQDERMKPDHDRMPFDGQRMFWGGFTPVSGL